MMKRLPQGMLGEGERLFPKLLSSGETGLREMAELISRRTSFTPGDVEGVLRELSAVVGEAVAMGHTVKIDGLGTLRPVLGLVEKEDRKEWSYVDNRLATGRNIRLKTVNFRPDKDLLRSITQRMTLERSGDLAGPLKPATTLEERAAKALLYIAEHGYMRVGDYASLVGLSRSTASLELRLLAGDENSGIMASGAGTGKVYVGRK